MTINQCKRVGNVCRVVAIICVLIIIVSLMCGAHEQLWEYAVWGIWVAVVIALPSVFFPGKRKLWNE